MIEIYSICMRLMMHLPPIYTLETKQQISQIPMEKTHSAYCHFRVSKDLKPNGPMANLQGTESKGPLKSRTTKSALVFLGGVPLTHANKRGGKWNLKRFGFTRLFHKIKVPEIPR